MKKEVYILFGLVAVFSFAFVPSAQAGVGDLVDASVTPAILYNNITTSYSLSFEVSSSTEIKAKIRLIFPAGFDVSGASGTSTIVASTTSANNIITDLTVSGQEITLSIADGAVAVTGDTLIFTGIPGIKNPQAVGGYTLGIQTRTAADEISDSASTTVFTIFAGSRKPQTLDTLPPTSRIRNPIDGLAISAGKPYTIKGTGVDDGGSVVDLVEVSLDGGQTWFRAFSSSIEGNFTWKYVWENPTAGEYTIQVRATDAKGNRESPSAGVGITVIVPAGAQTPTETPATTTIIQTLQNQVVVLQQTLLGLLQQLIQLLQVQL